MKIDRSYAPEPYEGGPSLSEPYYRDNLLAVLEACAAVPQIRDVLSCGDFFLEWIYKLQSMRSQAQPYPGEDFDPIVGRPNRKAEDLADALAKVVRS